MRIFAGSEGLAVAALMASGVSVDIVRDATTRS
jgi:hypothetical protein